MGNNIHRSSDHQALQETTLTTLGVVRMARIQGVVRKARTASQKKGVWFSELGLTVVAKSTSYAIYAGAT